MKYILICLFFFFNLFLSVGQVKVGDNGIGFYHAAINPQYSLIDTSSDDPDFTIIDLDLNGDSINDISLGTKWEWVPIPHSGGFYFVKWGQLFLNPKINIVINNNSFYADTMRYHDTINSATNMWSTSNTVGIYFSMNNATFIDQWIGQLDKYVGFKMLSSTNDTVYGWLRIYVPNYDKIIISEFACQSNYSTDTTINIGINENSIEPFNIFPIPFENYIICETNKKIEKVELFSVDGRLISGYNNPEKRISTLNLNRGIYIIVVHLANNTLIRRKIIKNN
ncbi:MAG: T9SS type A sorting domain-containing protein [Bacteroidia bacterium]|nr:T9SS type A sorting domain-containing protein [Bacteroidia bacterium]